MTNHEKWDLKLREAKDIYEHLRIMWEMIQAYLDMECDNYNCIEECDNRFEEWLNKEVEEHKSVQKTMS